MNHYLFKYAVERCKDKFIGKRISAVSIHSPTLLSFAFQDSDYRLFIDLSPQHSFFMPFKRTLEKKDRNDLPFFFFLKRNLPGLRLIDIFQKGSERVATLILEDIRGSIINRFNLTFEIIDRNTNAIFTNEKNIIIQAFKYTESSKIIAPKRKYRPTYSGMPDLLETEVNILRKRYKYNEDILGFSSHLRRLVSSEEDFVELLYRIRYTFITKRFSLYLYPKNVVLPFFFQRAIRKVDEDFVFDLFILKPLVLELENRKRNLLKVLRRRLNSLRRRELKVGGELKRAMDYNIYRIYAENLMANPNMNTSYLNSVELEDIYTQKPIIVPLNPRLNLFENAQVYFKKYKKAKKSVDLIKSRIEETKREILFVNQLLFDVEHVSKNEDLDDIINILINEKILKSTQRVRNVKSYVPYDKVTIEGFEAYIGKNARGNDIVTLKLSSKYDLWFHAKNRPSSHLILKIPSKLKRVDDSVIIKAAKFVADRSKAECGEKVDVDYAYVKDVKKPKGLKPGLMLYKNFKTVTVVKGECN